MKSLQSMDRKIHRQSFRNLKLLTGAGAIALLVVVLLCAVQIPKLSTQYSMRQFFPKNHPKLKLYDQVKSTFELNAAPSFYATIELPQDTPGTWVEAGNVHVLADLTASFKELPHVKSAVSLANIDVAVDDSKELRIGSLPDSVPEKDWAKTIDSLPLLRPQFISKNSRSVLIAIEPDTPNTKDLTALRNSIEKTLEVKASHYRTAVAGIPAVQLRLSEKLQTEVGIFFGFSLLIFVLMFSLFYKNASSVVFAASGLIACNAVVLGLLSHFGVSFSVLLSTLPVIVSIAFTSLAIHTLHLFADRLKEAKAPLTAEVRWRIAIATLKEIFLPNLLGSATTAIGFAMLATAPIPALREYASVVSFSVMITFVIGQCLMFVTLGWLTPVQRKWMRTRAWWTVPITRRAVPIFITIILVCVVMTGISSRLCFSARLFDDLPRGEKVRDAMNGVDADFGGTVSLDLILDAKSADAWKDPEALKTLARALVELRRLPDVGAVLGVTDFMGAKIPVTRQAVAESYFLYSMSPLNPTRSFVDNDFGKTRIAMRMRDLPTVQIEALRGQVREVLSKAFPQARLDETGMAVNSHTINQEVAKDLVFGFWQSLAVIGLLLVFVFRSVRWAFVACLPNFVPPAILAGALALAQTPVKPSVALIFSIALGLAFNNTVYLLTRLRRLRKEKKLDFLPLRRTLLEEGNPCLSESVLMFAGFLIFLASDFQLNQTLGAYMVLSIAAGALGDLVFLPALLKIFPKILLGSVGLERSERTEFRKGAIAAGAVGALILITFGSARAEADEAKDLLNLSRAALESTSDEAKVTLKIIEANGDAKNRELRLSSLHEGDTYHALVRIDAPADIKGTALLAEVKNGNEDQWLYLPSTKQVRRVVSGNKSAGVLGSELSPEDLNSDALKGAEAKLLKKDDKHAWIEVKPAGASEYSKIVLIMELAKHLPVQMDYYVGSNIKKKVFFKDYASVGKVQRARKIVVQNLMNRRSTEVSLTGLKVNGHLRAGDFTQAALKRGL